MTIIASCGHEVLSLDDLVNCSVADHDKLGYRAVSYMSLCGECYDYHKDEGYILYDEDEENKWLGGCEMRQSDGRTMDQKTTYGECSVELLRENPDGSADYQFNFPQEALDALTRLGILTAIKAGIEEAKRLNPDEHLEEEE